MNEMVQVFIADRLTPKLVSKLFSKTSARESKMGRDLLQTAFFLIGAVLLSACSAHTPKIVGLDGRIPEKSVSVIRTVRLGGLRQTIVIRGQDRDNPVLLF